MTPAVSILLPVHNEARFLPAALASLQRQTRPDWELVAVDNGSDDATPQILTEAARRDARIQVLAMPEPGLVPALNAGLERCRAPLVARMDGDDLCHPRRLELQLARLAAEPALTVLGCGVRHFPRPQLQAGMLHYEEWQNTLLEHDAIIRDLWVESPFAHPSVVMRRAALVAVGGYRDCGWAEDYDLWLRLAVAGAGFGKVAATLFFWRDRPERLTRTASSCTLEAFRACKVHHLKQGYLRAHDAVTLWGAGLEGKAWRQALAAAGLAVSRWIEVDRRKIGQRIHGAPVCGLDALRPGTGPLLVTIGARAARPQVRAFARQAGLVEGRDFLCVT